MEQSEITARAKQIGDRPAFPFTPYGGMPNNGSSGMTYRQWLRGKMLNGIYSNPGASDKPLVASIATVVQVELEYQARYELEQEESK